MLNEIFLYLDTVHTISYAKKSETSVGIEESFFKTILIVTNLYLVSTSC